MSHPHTHKEKSKKVKEELETLQESKQMAETIKADLLEHNRVLKIHDDTPPAPVTAQEDKHSYSSYIKRPEDMERITGNTSQKEAANKSSEDTLDNFQAPLRQVFELQLQTMTAFMDCWSNLMTMWLMKREFNS